MSTIYQTGLTDLNAMNQQYVAYKSLNINYNQLANLSVGAQFNGQTVTEFRKEDSLLSVRLSNGDYFEYRSGFSGDISEIKYQNDQFSYHIKGSLINESSKLGFVDSFKLSLSGHEVNYGSQISYGRFINHESYFELMDDLFADNIQSPFHLVVHGNELDNILYSGTGVKEVNGFAGNDTLLLNINKDELLNVIKTSENNYQITMGYDSTNNLLSVENLQFKNGESQDLASLVEEFKLIDKSIFFSYDTVEDNQNVLKKMFAKDYEGPVDYLEYAFIGDSTNNNIYGTQFNDFINGDAGDDGIYAGAGDDVLDGGTNSNFLTGGAGKDTFFSDGRGNGITWSTITDFEEGEQINIWGWQEGVSQLVISRNDDGVGSYKGATFHYDLNNDGTIDTSVTLTGINITDVSTSAQEVAGNGYILIV